MASQDDVSGGHVWWKGKLLSLTFFGLLLVFCLIAFQAFPAEIYAPPSSHFVLGNPTTKKAVMVCAWPLKNDSTMCFMAKPIALVSCTWEGGHDFQCNPVKNAKTTY